MASLETQLADVKAQAEADAVNAEHLSQAMEQRYATLAAEHAKVRVRTSLCTDRRERSRCRPPWGCLALSRGSRSESTPPCRAIVRQSPASSAIHRRDSECP